MTRPGSAASFFPRPRLLCHALALALAWLGATLAAPAMAMESNLVDLAKLSFEALSNTRVTSVSCMAGGSIPA